jgi:osmoprotectant transport system ATP-binding protein
VIKLSGITKSFEGVPVIDDFNATFDREKTYFLLGASGCGKSTLIRLIIGLVEADGGDISIDGKDIQDFGLLEVSETFGYVIQDAGLFPHLTVRDNVLMPTRVHGWPKEKQEKRLSELGELVQIDSEFFGKYSSQLSGGQKQRVGLMRALVLDPPYLLMDEPLSALDPIIRGELQSELKGIFKRLKKTVVFVSHDLHEAGFLADSIFLIHEGRIVQEGTLAEMEKFPSDEYVTRFISSQLYPTDFPDGHA